MWRIEQYGRPGQYALIDSGGGVAKVGTKEEMEALLPADTTKAVPAAPTTKENWPLLGDTIFVPYWREKVINEIDRGDWDVNLGSVISIYDDRVCYEPSNPSLPVHWGGEFYMVNERSPFRVVSRGSVFKTRKEAMEYTKKLKRPEVVRS